MLDIFQGTFVADSMDPNKTYSWFDRVFLKQEEIYNGNIFEQPESFIVK